MSMYRHRQNFRTSSRHAGFLVYPGFDMLHLSVPLEAFRLAGEFATGGYRLSIMSIDGGEVESDTRFSVVTRPATSDELDTLIIVGGYRPDKKTLPSGLRDFVCVASTFVRRVVGIGTGTLVLGESGLLKSGRVATNAETSSILKQVCPGIRVHCNHSFIHDRVLWTASGADAGLEVSLALIEQDLGRSFASAVARLLPIDRVAKSQYSSPLDQETEFQCHSTGTQFCTRTSGRFTPRRKAGQHCACQRYRIAEQVSRSDRSDSSSSSGTAASGKGQATGPRWAGAI